MKYMILTYASQQDYDGMAGQATEPAAWSPERTSPQWPPSWRSSSPNLPRARVR